MTGPLQHAELLLSTLHAFGGVIEITGLGPPKHKHVKHYFTDPHLAAEVGLELNWNGYSVFCGVNPHKAFSGFERDIAAVVALPLDLQPERSNIAGVIADLTRVGLPPSAKVVSGYGAHLYLYLDAPAPTDEAKLVSERLCKATNSDPIHNVNRVMRLPGTLNLKKNPPTWCYLVELTAQRFSLEQVTRGLDRLGAPHVAPKRVDVEMTVCEPQFDWLQLRERLSPHAREIIDSGEMNPYSTGQTTRSDTDWMVLCALVRAGATDDQVLWIYNNMPIGQLKYKRAGRRYLMHSLECARRQLAEPTRRRRVGYYNQHGRSGYSRSPNGSSFDHRIPR